ncbi:hypothetical protein L462_00970 [Enterobacter sp. BIDMC 26]|nr:hypothetical protein L462_00970 [Enterobacter sp. BIDMC 26]
MQLFVSFAQQQDFSTGSHVVPTNRFWVIGNVSIGTIGSVSQILFTGLGLSKMSHSETSSHLD